MHYFIETPNYIKTAFVEKGIVFKNLLYIVKGDLDVDGHYLDTYLTFDQERFYLLAGYQKLTKEGGSITFQETCYRSFSLADVEELSIERLVHTAQFLIKRDGKTETLCRFNIGYVEYFNKFKDRVMKTKNKEEIDDSRLKELEDKCPKCGMAYPDKHRRVCPHCINKFSLVKRLLAIYMEYKGYAIAMAVGILLSTAFSFIVPMFSNKMMIDDVLNKNGKYYGQVLWVIGCMIVIRVIGVLLSMAYGWLSAHIAPRMYHQLRLKAFIAMERQSLDYFTNRQTGALITRINDDTWTIYVFFVDMVQLCIVNLVTIAGLLGILFSMQSLLALFITAVISVVSILVRRFSRRQGKYYKKTNNAVRKLRSITSDVFNGQRVVKAFAKEKSEISRFSAGNEQLFCAQLDQANQVNRTFPFVRFLTRSGFALLFYGGALIILLGGNFTLGLLTAFLAYANMLQGPVDFFLNFSDWWSGCVDACSRIFEILDAEPSITEPEDAQALPHLRGDICLDHVSFEYETGRPILKDVSLKIKSGTMFGLVGKTGAGKSTIINLITRLYDVNEGSITIDGINLKEIRNADLRHNIGVVSQETYLFIGTVADNIRYSTPDAPMEEVVRAAKAAFAHDFIMKLPNGYDTKVGSGGVNLSGGERQRISIARAMLQKPSILILDEATAAMDTQTERRIQYAIDQLKQGRTIIAIAHRLSTLRDADMLACIDEGELKEIGTHDELIRQKGIYFELHKLQTEAFRFVEMGG